MEFAEADIYPQGFAAAFYRLQDFKGINMLVDIGNGTMNIMYINNSRPLEKKCFTEKYGTHQCVLAIRESLLKELGTVVDDLDISKKGLENEFNGNREKSRVVADRDSRANEELRNYYRELDAAITDARGIVNQAQSGEVVFERFLTIMLIMLGVAVSALIIWAGIEQYKKIWDDVYKMVLIFSLSFIAVLGNMIRLYIPVNLILLILFMNIGTVLFRMYLKNKLAI